MPRPVRESIRFRLRRPAAHVTLIFPHAPARMPLLKNPPVCSLSVNQSVIIYLIGTFPYGANDRSPYAERARHSPAQPWCSPIILLPCSHTLCQDTCRTTHVMPLDKSPLWCYHARVRVHVHIGGYPHTYPRRAVSPAGGLMHLPRCNCLGVGVWAVLGLLRARFGPESFQPSVNGRLNACLMSINPKTTYA